jgi:hypothetical protein
MSFDFPLFDCSEFGNFVITLITMVTITSTARNVVLLQRVTNVALTKYFLYILTANIVRAKMNPIL